MKWKFMPLNRIRATARFNVSARLADQKPLVLVEGVL